MIRRIAPVLCLALFAGTAAADSKFYYGLAFNSAELEAVTGAGLDTNGFNLKLGREFGPVFSLEGQWGVSAESTDNILRDPELDYYGFFARVNLPFEKVNLYLMAGPARFNINTGATIPEHDNEVEGAVGAGIDLLGSETTALTLEVLRYTKDEDFDTTLDVVQFGYTHRFEFPGFR